MALNIDIQPPTHSMEGRELLQFQQRVYEALKAVVDEIGGEVTTDHDDLENNGGEGSHAIITTHINSSRAHGTGSSIVGVNDSQVLKNKSIDADDNEISNLKHGEGVDNPTSAHGTEGDVVGENNVQTLKNKTLAGTDNEISGMRHGFEVDNLDNSVHGVLGNVVGTANAQVLINKRIAENMYSVTADYTASEYDTVIQVTALATITLPPAGIKKGMILKIDNLHTARITVIPNQVSETIEGETSQRVPPNSCMNVQSNGTIWRIV